MTLVSLSVHIDHYCLNIVSDNLHGIDNSAGVFRSTSYLLGTNKEVLPSQQRL